MPKIACRWPGGMDVALLRHSTQPIVIHLNGPVGEPSLLPPSTSVKPPSRDAATLLHKRVADTVKRMQDTAHEDFGPPDYGVTDIPGPFWAEWYDNHRDLDVVTCRMVFAL